MDNAAQVIDHLDCISRRRALTLPESLQLERAIKTEAEKQPRRRTPHEADWRPSEDELIVRLRSKRIRAHKLTYKDIAEILEIVGISPAYRSLDAVAARLLVLCGRRGSQKR
jgi:hypothetical protein